jgi:hypothetical protein
VGPAVQRPVAAVQTVVPVHWMPPTWPQPGTHWPVSQTVIGGMQAESFWQGPWTGTQRPVAESHIVPVAHCRPPGWPQPGTQALDWQTIAGGPHWVSLEQVIGCMQRPVVESQVLPPLHCRPPTWPQPGTHWEETQIVFGGLHIVSEVQELWPCTQRPVLELQTSVPVQVIALPGEAQPGVHWRFSQTALGGLQSGSVEQPVPLSGVGCTEPSSWLASGLSPVAPESNSPRTIPPSVEVIGPLQVIVVGSQCCPIGVHCMSEVQLRLPATHSPLPLSHLRPAGQTESSMQEMMCLQAPLARSQYRPVPQELSVLQPGWSAATHLPFRHSWPEEQLRFVTQEPAPSESPLQPLAIAPIAAVAVITAVARKSARAL